ncbi:MAG: PAS domain S-box protein [Candidatus Sericytochromatia bacterium]
MSELLLFLPPAPWGQAPLWQDLLASCDTRTLDLASPPPQTQSVLLLPLESASEASLSWLRTLRKTQPDLPVLLLLANAEEARALPSDLGPSDLLLTPSREELLLRAERLLQASPSDLPAIYEALFNQAGVGVAQLESRSGRFRRINRKYTELMGYSAREIRQLTFMDISHPDELPTDLAQMERLIQGEIQEFSMEKRLYRRDRSTLWVQLTVTRMENAPGEPVCHIAVIQDITRQREHQHLQQEQDARFRQMFETHHAIMLLINPSSGCIVSANQAAADFYGYPRSELQNKPIAEINILDSHEIAQEMARARAKELNYFVFPHRLASGEIRTVEIHSTPVEIHGQQLLFSIIHDITERRLAEAALRQSEGQYRQLFEIAPLGIGVANPQGHLLAFNEALLKPGGYSRAEMEAVGHVSALYHNPQEHDTVLERFQKQGYLTRHEVRFKRRNGRPYETLLTLAPIFFAGQSCVLALVEDITERKLAEKALRDSEARYREIVETAEEGIWMLDTEDCTSFVNFKMVQMLEWAHPVQMLGRPLFDFMDDEGREVAELNLERRRNGIREMHDFKLLTRSGREIWTTMATTPIYDEHGNYAGALAMVTDITERRLWEQELQISLNEREVLLREIHHRVKNNFQVIISLLNMQCRKLKDEAAVRPLLDSRHRIRSMALVHERLYESQSVAQVDFAEYLHYLTRELYSPEWKDPNRIKLHFDLEPLTLDIDQAIPCGLLVNELLANAFQYAFPADFSGPCQIQVKLHRDGEMVELTLSDNGVGFGPDTLQQSPHALGLQLVHQLSRQLNGSCIPAQHNGTTWTLRFPYQDPDSRPARPML